MYRITSSEAHKNVCVYSYCIRSCANEDKATIEEDAGETRWSKTGVKGVERGEKRQEATEG